jgi:hypothetical protein
MCQFDYNSLSTTNPTPVYWDLNPGIRDEKPETNRLIHGTTWYSVFRRVRKTAKSDY